MDRGRRRRAAAELRAGQRRRRGARAGAARLARRNPADREADEEARRAGVLPRNRAAPEGGGPVRRLQRPRWHGRGGAGLVLSAGLRWNRLSPAGLRGHTSRARILRKRDQESGFREEKNRKALG